jgi:hypothetical protein
MNLTPSNSLRDIQEQLQLMCTQMTDLSNQITNLSKRVKSIKTFQVRQSNDNKHPNNNYQYHPMPIHNKHHNHWHHDVYNDPDDRVIKHIKTEALDFNGCLDP